MLPPLELFQRVVSHVYGVKPRPQDALLSGPRIAIIGAGLTGVSAAAHCVANGSEVVLFEAGDREKLGGIWAKVNDTSSLQIHALMYRFHPTICWKTEFPGREEIVGEITGLWKRYGLENRTKFNTKVTSIKGEDGNWVVNDGEYGKFDGVIAAIGTCGDLKMPRLPNQEVFGGKIVHSTQLDGVDVRGKKVIVIGGGASAVEALEWAVAKGADKVNVLSRSDKWIVPRNFILGMVLSMAIFAYLTDILERLLRRFFYRDLAYLSPEQSLWEGTPMANDEVFKLIRSGKASWTRGDIQNLSENGVQFRQRDKGVPVGGAGKDIFVEGDIVVSATGFHRPSLGFLPREVFQKPYPPPSWYLQSIPPDHFSICASNCTYLEGVGTVGHFHIGMYTRLLLMFLSDPLTRPDGATMKAWIDTTRWLKENCPVVAFEFYTYGEMLLWVVSCMLLSPFRWRYVCFVLFGWGGIVHERDFAKEKALAKEKAINGDDVAEDVSLAEEVDQVW